jgi:uncharacterized membrane protein
MGEARSRQRFIGVLSSILVMGELVIPVEQVICVGVVAFALAGFAAILVFMAREAGIVLGGVKEGVEFGWRLGRRSHHII